MHVLREPIQRHLAAETLSFRRGIDLGADGRKLRTETDVIDETGDLRVVLSALDATANKIGNGRQGLPIDSSGGRMIPSLKSSRSNCASSEEVLLFSVS
jgi:hypothetical protein